MNVAASLGTTPYAGYSYAYPHKTAYRRLDPALPLDDVWRDEEREALFLYLHVPFCEYRCGFCNLFTQAQPETGVTTRYLRQLRVEAEVVCAAFGEASFVRVAIGGGTPTFLNPQELTELLDIAMEVMGAPLGKIPVACEASPSTVTAEKLALLRERGVERLSLGIQAFDEKGAQRLGRPQRRADVERALALARDCGIPTLNLDLIYGGEGETAERLADNVREALAWRPEEVYLYPLYVRPLTGLGGRDGDWDDQRLAAYRAGREVLLEASYEQVSMRMFRLPQGANDAGPVYCCQNDGMVGLGCGARSYTRGLHYSTEYAVGRPGVASILGDYLRRPAESFAAARHGFRLSRDEQQRRFAILSLLQAEGIDRRAFAERFDVDVLEALPQLAELPAIGWGFISEECVRLTPEGLAWSDAIGPWLYSPQVQALMAEYELR